MQTSKQPLLAGAALCLAILYPLYWIMDIKQYGFDLDSLHINLLQLSLSDWLFLGLGVLSIAIYLGLKRSLNECYGILLTDIPLYLLAGLSVVFFVGFFGLDLSFNIIGQAMDVTARHAVVEASVIVFIACIIAYGALEIVLGVFLLKNFDKLNAPLKIFSVVTLIQGFCDLTFIFSIISIVTFPICLIALAMHFLSDQEELALV